MLKITNNSATKGTTNINDALGDVFNTRGESNGPTKVSEKPVSVIQPEKSVTNIEYNKLPEEINQSDNPFITPKVTKATEHVTIGGAKEVNNNNNGFNSENVLSIDDVITVDKNLKNTDYKSTRTRAKKHKPILVDPSILDMIKNQHKIPEYSEFTTTSHISCIKDKTSI